MLRVLIAGFHTIGAIRQSVFAVVAGLWALIFAVGVVRVGVGGDWIDAILLILLSAGLFLSARHYYNIARNAVVAARMKARV